MPAVMTVGCDRRGQRDQDQPRIQGRPVKKYHDEGVLRVVQRQMQKPQGREPGYYKQKLKKQPGHSQLLMFAYIELTPGFFHDPE